ncbi:LD-carboxypeptidase LdcB [Bacillus spizizenii]|nr:LD-carboxypeptidase LdcB [Bacillus spizizenii]MCY8168396.1 LD-carboxypeptidase LdcB [Bacillus spizizenii]MCY9254189.1 LD-carboxypeptidase LdcB [Bacillus spizizenii]MEC0612193.1 LD-carboxypeptidase LdcB [Bacillus spizizenii]
MKKSGKWFSLAAALSVTAIVGAGCSMSNGDAQKDTKTTVETKQTDQKTTDSKKTNTQDSEFSLESKYFNDTKKVDGLETIQNPENILALVNKQYALPGNYEPSDLVVPDVEFSFEEKIQKRYIRKEAADALKTMFDAAKKEGYELAAVSGYRSYDRQKVIFDNEVSLKGEKKAKEAVAYPGESEHQTGLAMDISSRSNGFELNEAFGSTADGKWVQDNAYKYGFIIRYPKNKEDITKYEYEPWHLRYVGKKAAKVMQDNDLTLEEYFEKVKKI